MDALEFHVYLDPPPSETRAMALARCHAASRASSDATDGSRDAAMCGTGTSPGFSRRSSVSAFSIASGGSCGSAGR